MRWGLGFPGGLWLLASVLRLDSVTVSDCIYLQTLCYLLINLYKQENTDFKMLIIF